jgi:hypothetical protein
VQRDALETVRPDTLVSQLGVSTRAQNTLDRLGIFTAQELAAQPPGRFSSLRGVGNKTRREIMDLIGKLRTRLPQPAIPDHSIVEASAKQPGDEATAPLSVDALTALLVPVETSASGKVSRHILARFLELDDAPTGPPTYPTQAQVADRTGKSRAQIRQVITKARERWRKSCPDLTPVRSELASFLEAEGGVAEVGELAQFLLASRRSHASEPLATRRAAAVVRAALEAEKPSESNRFEERRSGSLFLVACSEAPFGEPALDYAEKLGEAAAKLAAADPLPSPTRVLEDLRAVPITIPSLREERLVRLAAKVANVAVSPRLELYPKNLDALRAVKLAQAAVAGLASIAPDDLRNRVRDRYPEAQPLPDRPDLDNLVREAGLDLTWKETEAAYCAPPAPVLASSTSLHREQTVVSPSLFVPPVELPREMEDALAFERRLQAAYRSPSYLVLATEPKLCHLQMAQTNLKHSA